VNNSQILTKLGTHGLQTLPYLLKLKLKNHVIHESHSKKRWSQRGWRNSSTAPLRIVYIKIIENTSIWSFLKLFSIIFAFYFLKIVNLVTTETIPRKRKSAEGSDGRPNWTFWFLFENFYFVFDQKPKRQKLLY